METILNLCGGKIIPKLQENQFLVNLDLSYKFGADSIDYVRHEHLNWVNYNSEKYYIKHDVYDFLENYDIPFDKILIYRFLEHVPKSQVLYFIYLLSTITKPGAILDIIVPDYKVLAQRILREEPYNPDVNFEAEDIITTYELLNTPESPHQSVWTVDRFNYFFHLEGRFLVRKVIQNFKFDGRDLYLRAEIERI
jgi:hypothetical protein